MDYYSGVRINVGLRGSFFPLGTAVEDGSVTGFVNFVYADRQISLPSSSNARTCQLNSPPHENDSIQRVYSVKLVGKVINVPLGAVTTTAYDAASVFDSHEKLICPKLPKLDESGGASGTRQAGAVVPVVVTVWVVDGMTVDVTVCVADDSRVVVRVVVAAGAAFRLSGVLDFSFGSSDWIFEGRVAVGPECGFVKYLWRSQTQPRLVRISNPIRNNAL